MAEILKFTLYGNPASKKNSMKIIRLGNRAGLTQSDIYKEYARTCARQIPAGLRIGIDYPVNIKAVFYRDSRRRCDRPNLENALLDVLTECGVIADDCRDIAAAGDGTRVYYDRENPRTEVTITVLDEDYERWAKEKKQ